ncbi:hypothetical protein Sango_0746000 [Sesamum angolense]|uniref:Zinc finger PHD-type domain-containing protein n=1 Tax=Sesamum angolense TaxID=2727404 RepID=A0AAE2BZS1_9LAMI|nr:hypothetical protein Sango_0746000 [Sesamum angolense]
MNKRRERTLQDLCDVTPTLSKPQITPVLSGNFRMQGPVDEANCDLLTHMVKPENSKGFSSCCDRSQKVEYTAKSGTCNVCSAPCSSCFHVNKVLMRSSDESAGETCAENSEIGQLSVLSAVAGMNSTSDSFSENAVGKASSRASHASASDDSVVHSKSESRRVPEGHDDCLSCVSGTDEHANRKSDTEDSKIYNNLNKCSGESSDKSDIKDEPLDGSTEHLDPLLPRGVASDIVCGDPPPTVFNSVKKNDDMEVEVHPVDETDDSDMVEHDVKVCDICGDAGREDLLAICCRCSDGAEHTYCMREMMEKVPEGEWLCEECKTMDQEGVGRQEKNGGMDENEKNNSSGQASSEYVNGSDVEGPRTKAKKPALEPAVRSPKTSSSSKLAALSRENSLKYTEKGRLQSSHHSSSETVPVNDTTESAGSASNLRVNTSRGTFSKSKSFNSLNSKPKVKLVDQVVIQRQKSAKEHGSFRLKEGVVRAIGKSMSFKCTNSTRSESKLKMLSPRPTQNQDSKSTKQRTPFERHHSFKAEHPSANSIMGTSMSSTSRIEKKQVSRAESSSLATIANHHDMKPVQTDGRSAALTRSSGLAARRTAELSSSLGEFKKPSAYGNLGVSSAGGVNSIEQKSNRTSLKEDAAGSVVADRPSLSANEVLPDGLPRPGDLTSSGERMREYSSSRFGQSSVKSLRDESDNLKAAIEAAVLRKPGVYRKHRALSQSDESSMSSVACEVASHQDHISSSAGNKKLASSAELPEVSRNLNGDHLKQETLSSVKQSSLVPVEGLPSGARDGVHNGPFSRDVFSNSPTALPAFLKYLAIPEHEHIWQGSFEICRSGETFDSWDGIQAHLSTSASPKVIEAVNKFKSRIVLYEVPRKSTWPIQFQERGKDLALKGNVNGVELLIFPSNQLPDKSQRWNMLFFLWGVFRGKKESCLQMMPESLNQCCAPRDIPPPIMSLPENRCSLGPITEDLLVSEDAAPVLEVPASEEIPSVLSSRAVANVSSLDPLNHGPNSSSTAAGESESAKQCQEREGGISSSCSPHLPIRSYSFSGREQMMQVDTRLLDRQQSSHHSSKSVAGELKAGTGEGTLLDRSSKICNQNRVKLSVDAGDLSTGGETPLEDHQETRDLNVEHRRWPFNNDSTHPAPSVMRQTLYAGTSKVALRNDDTRNETCGVLEKINHVPSSSYAVHNRHQEGSVETLIPGRNEHAERRFFPIEQPVKGIQSADGSTPWKMHLLEPDRFNDRAPNLELALGAEIKPLSLGTRSVLVSKVDQTVNEEHIREEARSKADDDVSASLSLSLSFPFPEKELSTKPAPKTEQLVSEREHVNTSMLLFGNLRDN